MFGPGPNTPFAWLSEEYKNNRLFYDAFVGIPSNYMQQRWQAILDQQLATFTKIVAGDLAVDAGFDDWVKTFNSMGGERITQEVNAWYKSK
jgi:putative aldouronate transport system substrate-binding protein